METLEEEAARMDAIAKDLNGKTLEELEALHAMYKLFHQEIDAFIALGIDELKALAHMLKDERPLTLYCIVVALCIKGLACKNP